MMNKHLKLPDMSESVEQLQSIIDANIARLESMINTIQEPSGFNPSLLISKLKRARNGEDCSFSTDDVVLLGFNCAAITDDLLSFYLQHIALQHKSKELMQGLVFSLVRSWNKYEHRKLLMSFISENKSLLNKRLQSVESVLLKDEGPEILGRYIGNGDIYSAPEYICLNRKWIESDYFEYVIVGNFKERPITKDNLDAVSLLLDKFRKRRLNKLLLSEIVCHADKIVKDETLKTILIGKCNKYIGTVEDTSKWEELTFNEKEKSLLFNCRNILRRWQNEKAIILVLGRLAHNDDRRLKYWKPKAAAITRIKIYSTIPIGDSMKAGIPQDGFKWLSSGPSNTALLMRVGDWTIVELMEGGCSYFYHDEPGLQLNMHRRVWNKYVDTIEDLLNRDLPPLTVDIVKDNLVHSFPCNCKIEHKGIWEDKFDAFIREKEILKYKDIHSL